MKPSLHCFSSCFLSSSQRYFWRISVKLNCSVSANNCFSSWLHFSEPNVTAQPPLPAIPPSTYSQTSGKYIDIRGRLLHPASLSNQLSYARLVNSSSCHGLIDSLPTAPSHLNPAVFWRAYQVNRKIEPEKEDLGKRGVTNDVGKSFVIEKQGPCSKLPSSHSGWSYEEVCSWPNLISMARLLSGPPIALLVLHGHGEAALIGLTLGGVSDWLDGYMARWLNRHSVLGSYLDPLADKVLIGCVAIALYLQGWLPGWLLVLTMGRDVGLMAGAAVHRANQLQWKWGSVSNYFHIGHGGAEVMKPLFVSKLNTAFQFTLMSAALFNSIWDGQIPNEVLLYLGYTVGATTVLSGAAYVTIWLRKSKVLLH